MNERTFQRRKGERLPLKGIRLWRWKFAILIYRIGCVVSGRHYYLQEWDENWKVWFCPHCDWTDDR